MENLPPIDLESNTKYNPRSDKTLIHRSGRRRNLSHTGFIEFYIKKIYNFICVKSFKRLRAKVCYKKSVFHLSVNAINLLKRLSRKVFG